MGKKDKKIQIAAAIEIGSNALRMKIAEVKQDEIKILEYLRCSISLGKECFSIGKISFDTLDKTCEILRGFLNKIEEYGIEQIDTFATTAIREASNREYILDQIYVKTGLNVRVLENTEEKVYIYKSVCKSIEEHKKFNSKAPIVYIGSGSIGMALYDNGIINFTQSIEVGSLKINEILADVQDKTENYYVVVEEYLKAFTGMLRSMLPIVDSKYFFILGREAETIASLCGAEIDGDFCYVTKKKFTELYDRIKKETVPQIMESCRVSEEKAEVLLPSMAIYNEFLSFTEAEVITLPQIYLTDVIIDNMLSNKQAEKWDKVFRESTILSARKIAQRYNSFSKHEINIEKYSLKIFDSMKKVHGLGKKERLYLQVAALLHDTGKFINLKNHSENSYNIIKNSDIFGLNPTETEIIAIIAKYHGSNLLSLNEFDYMKLTSAQRVLVSKLTAILRLADALDRGHEQKFDDIDVKIKDKQMIVSFSTYKDTIMEEWSFAQNRELFEEVYGIKAVINKKRVNL